MTLRTHGPTERRTSARRRTFLGGRIEVPRLGPWEVDCTVRNLSATGDNLAISGETIVPTTFGLSVDGGASEPARIVWHRAGRLGVALGERRSAGVPDWAGPWRRITDPSAHATAASQDPLRRRMDAVLARSRRRRLP